MDRWRVQREGTVASKTYNTEGYALKHLESLRKRPLATVSAADLNALCASMLKKLSRDTVVRFRQIVSAFYSWAVSEKLVAKNPVLESKVPAGTAQRARKEIFPFTYAELVAVHAVLVANTSKRLADIMLVLGLTGIRWGELAALRVRDVQELPYPALRVVRSKPDGQPVRNVTKGASREPYRSPTTPQRSFFRWSPVGCLTNSCSRQPLEGSVRTKISSAMPTGRSTVGSPDSRPPPQRGDDLAQRRRGPEDGADLAGSLDGEAHRRHL